MKKLIKLLTSIAYDKWLHGTLAMHIFLVFVCLLHFVGYEKTGTICCSAVVAFSVSIFKEIWDDVEGGGSDSADFAADMIGLAIGIVYAIILI